MRLRVPALSALSLPLVLAAGTLPGCATDGADDSAAATGDATWAEVQPILAENCHGCHAADGIAFPLEGYDDASGWAHAIADATEARRMPPWPPEEDCRPLKGVRGLTDEEIATLGAWAEAGAPQGDGEDLASSDVPSSEDTSAADLWVELDEPFTPDQALSDDYRCFVVDPELSQDTWVTQFEVFPGNVKIVHHVLLYSDPLDQGAALDAEDDAPGYPCYGGPGVDDSQTLGAWVPGMDDGVVFPEGTGVKLDAGTKLVLQVHYAPQGDPGRPDQTRMGMHTETSGVETLYIVPFLDYDLDIPAGASAHVEGDSYTNDYLDFRIWGLLPHMHKLGKEIRATVTRADGTEECGVDIPAWDFAYQQLYFFEEPMDFEVGDTLELECVYDNSADNPDNPNSPPQDTQWGDGTADEMCLVYVVATL